MNSKIRSTRVSPSAREIGWLAHQLTIIQPKSFLEFGAGITSKTIYNTIHPNPYVIVENFQPLVQLIPIELPNAHLITTTWDDIPQQQYDAILIDSSAGYPPAPTKPALRRMNALHWCIDNNLIRKYMIIHDAFGRSGAALYKYMTKDPNFTLVSKKHSKKGFAMFSYEPNNLL